MNESLLLLIYQVKMLSSLWEAIKVNLLESMNENFQFLTFLTLNSLFTLENSPLLTFWVTFPIRKSKWQLACIKVQLNLWHAQNINEELFKVEYLIKLSQYFKNLAEAVMRLYKKTLFSKAFKVLYSTSLLALHIVYIQDDSFSCNFCLRNFEI